MIQKEHFDPNDSDFNVLVQGFIKVRVQFFEVILLDDLLCNVVKKVIDKGLEVPDHGGPGCGDFGWNSGNKHQ